VLTREKQQALATLEPAMVARVTREKQEVLEW
jgi:hypothetical protein